jgi:hypothetical protein
MIRLNKTMVLLFLMLLALPLASRAKDTFYIEPVNVVPGESKTITLNLDNSQVFRGFQTDIELPEGLKIASKSNGNFDISLTDRGSSSFSVSSNLMSDGSVRILGYSTQGESIKGNQGALVRISVRASSDFSGGYIKLKNSIFSDVNNRDVKLDNSQLFVGTKEQNDVSVKGGEISPEVSKAFSFELSNESEMTAFQMDVVLPNGLSLDLSKTRLTGRCGNHQLQTKQLGNGKVRIICMSSDNTSISGKIGSVIDLWIKAEKGITGNQIVKLENIIFSDVKARTYRMDPFSFVVDVKYVPVTSVSISESNMQLEVSDSRQLTASLLPENCTDKTILWKSDNEKVAIVSDNGMIIARSAGQCSIVASTADNLIQAKCVVTVVKIPLTAHVANTTKVYGDANPEFNITYSGFRDGDSEVGFSVPASISTIVDNSSKVGKYDIVASGAVSDKYEISYIPGTLTITKAPLSISAGNYTKKQGDAMPVFKASYAGFKNGENESVLTKQPVFSCEANEASAPAEYAVTISGAEAENYDISYEQGRLTVVEADAVVVRAKSYNRQYGDENPVFEFETEGAALDGTPEIVCSAVANSPVGSYTIEVKQGSIKNYNVHFESGGLEITKAPLSISAGNYTKKQGDAMPVFKASYAGFKNGEDESVLTKQPVFSCEANEASAPAEYAVTISGADAENYDISYEQGHLTVVEADAVVVRAKSYSRQYGEENPVFEFETEGAALDGTPEIVCSAVANSPVGSYTIEVKQGSIKNYNVHFESGSLVITKAPLSISAGNYTKKQGDAMPVFKASYAGFKNGENESVLTKQPVFSCEANEASAPAEYAVTISGAEAENYAISYKQGVLTVTGMPKPIISTDEATLRITTETDNAVIYYTLDGTEPNENARKYTEPINLYASCEIKAIAVNGDAKSEVSSAEYHDAEYPNIVKVGDIITANIINNGEENLPMIFKVTSVYPFNVEMENKEDYVEGWSNERDVSGTLEIPVVVKSNGISYCVKKLGDNSLARCVNVSSLKLNEGLESIGHQAIRWCRNIKELIVPNSVKEVWGAFLTEDHGLVSVVLGSGLETIHTDAFWGVSMNLKSFISLSTNPAKCVEPDRTFTSLPEDVTLYVPLGSKSAYETAPGWDYFAGHIVEMDMSPATVKVKDCSREYGDDNPTLEFETEGATLIGEPEIICSVDKNSKVGTYEIEINKGTIKNYLVTFVPGTLTVTKAPLVVTAENYTITQGDKVPEFTANYSGFKNGEDVSVLTKQPVFSCDANEASAPGEYPINVYGVEADNYNAISYVAGTLTVLKRELKKQTITWDQEIKAKVGSTIEMNATASSGLPVRYLYALAPGVETAYQVPQIEGNKITFPQNGMYLLVAIQDGNNEYAAATDTLDVCAISDDEGLMYIDGIYYKYTDDGSALKVVRGYNPYRGKVEIPATVNGLPVTEVDGLAMYACYYLKELVIGDNVKKCGHEAFGASINLCNVTLPVADVEFTHNWMFNCDRGIREIHCRSSIPYVVDEGIFNGAVDYGKCILYVPVGTKQSYANSEVWKNFTHIVEENVSTNISNIIVEKKSVWHTLQGVKLFAKPNIPGVYIHNGKKIIVR